MVLLLPLLLVLADLWKNCAFDDKSMKLCVMMHYRVLQIFGYRLRAISNVTFTSIFNTENCFISHCTNMLHTHYTHVHSRTHTQHTQTLCTHTYTITIHSIAFCVVCHVRYLLCREYGVVLSSVSGVAG